MSFDPNDAPVGFLAVKAPRGCVDFTCDKCFFKSDDDCSARRCTAKERVDGSYAYFIPKAACTEPVIVGPGQPPTLLDQAVALLDEIDIVPSTEWADRRASLRAKAKQL